MTVYNVITETELGSFKRVGPGRPSHENFMFKCPGCGVWAFLDADQWNGRVSVDHAADGCRGQYHEIHNYGESLGTAMFDDDEVVKDGSEPGNFGDEP